MSVFAGVDVAPLADRDYFPFMLGAVEGARRRVWVAMFLWDLRPSRDVAGLVMRLTTGLVDRFTVGVDVRVLLSGEVSTPDIAVANRATALFLHRHGVPSRHAFSTGQDLRRGWHAKEVIVDQTAVVGSQNWTDDAFRLNVEDAVVVTGEPVEALASDFQSRWQNGRAVTT